MFSLLQSVIQCGLFVFDLAAAQPFDELLPCLLKPVRVVEYNEATYIHAHPSDHQVVLGTERLVPSVMLAHCATHGESLMRLRTLQRQVQNGRADIIKEDVDQVRRCLLETRLEIISLVISYASHILRCTGLVLKRLN